MKLIKYKTYDICFNDKSFKKNQHYIGPAIFLKKATFCSEYIYTILPNGHEADFRHEDVKGISKNQINIEMVSCWHCKGTGKYLAKK